MKHLKSDNHINDNKDYEKIVQIQIQDEYPVTYFVNDYNIHEISRITGLSKHNLSNGFKYYLNNENKTFYSEPIDAYQKISLNIPININSASENDLISLPGIGIYTARRIIMYRNKNGNFKNISDLKNIYGIGIYKFSKVKKFISVD